MKSIARFLCAAVCIFTLLVSIGCAKSDVVGTWYSVDKDGLETLIFENNGTGYHTPNNMAFEWEESDATVIINVGYVSQAYQKLGDTLVSGTIVYYRSEEEAQRVYDEAEAQKAAEKLEKATADYDAYMDEMLREIVGEYECNDEFNTSGHELRYYKCTVNEDGTWSGTARYVVEGKWLQEDFEGSVDFEGTWALSYEGDLADGFSETNVRIDATSNIVDNEEAQLILDAVGYFGEEPVSGFPYYNNPSNYASGGYSGIRTSVAKIE